MLGFITLGAFLFWSAVMVGLMYLAGTIIAPSQPEMEEEVEGAQSRLWSPHTTQKEGIARPRAYGKNMHHGNILARWTDVVDNREVLYLIVEHGEGPTKGIVDPIGSNIFLNDQPLSNFTSVAAQERLGTMGQSCMTGFEKMKLEYSQNIELIKDEAVTVFTTPNNFSDDLEYTISFPNGLIDYAKDGDACNSSGHLKVRIRELEGIWSEIYNDNMTAATREPRFYDFKVSDYYACSQGTQYELEFSRLNVLSSRGSSNMFLRSVREVVDTAFTHPGKALVGIRAVATAQLSGSIDVKVIREDRIINVYDSGTGEWTLEYSNNRAWVAWDMLTLPAIEGESLETYEIVRYDGIGPEFLDLEFFHNWSLFCDELILDGYGSTEPRISCNTIVDEFTNIFDLVYRVAAIGRANIYWQGHQLTGWIDDVVTTPIDLVTMDSIMTKTWKNSWTIRPELAGVIEVFYKDEKQGFERTSAEYANDDAGGFRNIVSLEGIGIISRGQAVHYANYLLERNHLIRNVNKFKVHKDGFRYKLGDTIRLQSRPSNWGSAFRVISATVDTITVDRNAEDEVSVDDTLFIRVYDDVLEEVVTYDYPVGSVSGKVISLSAGEWDILPIKGNLVAVGAANDIKLRRIIKLTPTTDNYFNVEVETYDAALYNADDVDPTNPNANYIWPGAIAGLDKPLTRAEIITLITQGNIPLPDLNIPWTSNVDWNSNTPEAGYISWSRIDDSDNILFRLRGTSYTITPGNTNKEFVYWHPDFPEIFSTTDSATTLVAAILAGAWSMCSNLDGIAHAATPTQIIHGALIQAGTIFAKQIYVSGLDTNGKLVLSQIGTGDADNINEGATNKFAAESGADVTGAHEADISIENITDGTVYKKYLNTEKTKLTGVETSADVTGNHQADIYLANLGERSIDNLINGTYAKMPANWRAGDITYIDGGRIYTDTILAEAISTYNLTAANCIFENLVVKTAYIDNLAVGTGQLAANAGHTDVSNYNAEQGLTLGSWVQVSTANITSLGKIIQACCNCTVRTNTSSVYYANSGYIRIQCGGETVGQGNFSCANGQESVASVFAMGQPGAGAKTYDVDIKLMSGLGTTKYALVINQTLLEHKGK